MPSVSNSPAMHARHADRTAPSETAPTDRPGKSGQSVGHRAKAAIAGMATDQPLTANFQGQVASALARGLPVEALLALQQSPDVTGEDTGTDATTDTATTDVATTDTTVTDTATTDTTVTDIATTDPTVASDAAILDLLEEAAEDQTADPSAGS